MSDFKGRRFPTDGRRFPTDVILADQTTLYRWVRRYAPLMEKRIRWQLSSEVHKSRILKERFLPENQGLLRDRSVGWYTNHEIWGN